MVCVAVVALARYGHPLRFYITPHCPQCPPVAALKLRLVAVTASRPSGEGNRRYAKWPSLGTVAQPSALPGRVRALRAANWLPCGCCGTVALVRRFAQGVWSVACGQSSCMCPAHPCGPRRYAAFGPALGARPPPRGSLIPAPNTSGCSKKITAGASRLRCSRTTPPTSR